MKLREIYEYILIESHKLNAPNLKLFEFNYYINKAINQVVNKIYNIYDTTQQTSDDLRVLVKNNVELIQGKLPNDYLHLLNCICTFEATDKYKNCIKKGDVIQVVATKATSDSWGQILQDAYNKPSYKKPYYKIVNGYAEKEPVEVSKLIIEYGKGPFELKSVSIDYLKIPNKMELTQNQVDMINDTSSDMEFPDYINQEIINELVHLVMERASDPRLSTNLQITQSIARPTQQQAT